MATHTAKKLFEFPSKPVQQIPAADLPTLPAAEEMDYVRISQLTKLMFSIANQEFFKKGGFTVDELAASALSVYMMHADGVSDACVAAASKAYPGVLIK